MVFAPDNPAAAPPGLPMTAEEEFERYHPTLRADGNASNDW